MPQMRLALAQSLFALPQREFGPLSLGDVEINTRHAKRRAVCRDLDLPEARDPPDFARRQDHPMVRLKILFRAPQSSL